MPTGAALTLTVVAVVAALVAVLWAGLLAMAEEAAVGEAAHTLGDAPSAARGGPSPASASSC